MARKNTTTNATTTTSTSATATNTPKNFGEKVRLANIFFENLRLDAEISKKLEQLAKLAKKDGKTAEDTARQKKLTAEKEALVSLRNLFISEYGNPTQTEAMEDMFAFVCAWTINPVKGRAYTDKTTNTKHYDIAFGGMFQLAAKIKGYYKEHFDRVESEKKTEARKELVEFLDKFVNDRVPHEKSATPLAPCKDSTMKLVFAKLIEDENGNPIFSEKEYAYPKNCMEGGYKPMNVHFVDTVEKPMLRDLVASVAGKYGWKKDGINRTKVDEYFIVQQTLLTAFKYCLNFGDGATATTVTAGIIM